MMLICQNNYTQNSKLSFPIQVCMTCVIMKKYFAGNHSTCNRNPTGFAEVLVYNMNQKLK